MRALLIKIHCNVGMSRTFLRIEAYVLFTFYGLSKVVEPRHIAKSTNAVVIGIVNL